tara:strand:+ start:61 stop:663 length:603 start_codon:yes stop_codon:yes gene_type:complete
MSNVTKSAVDQVLETVQANPPGNYHLGSNFPEAMKDFMKAVRFHESKGRYYAIQDINKRVMGKKVPWPGVQHGPGRGAYQFEMDAYGGSGANKTAIQRARNLYDKFGWKGSWIDSLMDRGRPKDIDFSTLENWKQDVIFIADKYYENNISMKNLEEAYEAPDSTRHKIQAEAWGKGHKRSSDYIFDLDNDHGYKHLRGAK